MPNREKVAVKKTIIINGWQTNHAGSYDGYSENYGWKPTGMHLHERDCCFNQVSI